MTGQPDSRDETVPRAEVPRGIEQEVAAGRVPSTPLSMITWVGVGLALLAGVALGIVVIAYVLA